MPGAGGGLGTGPPLLTPRGWARGGARSRFPGGCRVLRARWRRRPFPPPSPPPTVAASGVRGRTLGGGVPAGPSGAPHTVLGELWGWGQREGAPGAPQPAWSPHVCSSPPSALPPCPGWLPWGREYPKCDVQGVTPSPPPLFLCLCSVYVASAAEARGRCLLCGCR